MLTTANLIAALAGAVAGLVGALVSAVLVVGRFLERQARQQEAISALQAGSIAKGERLEALARELAEFRGRVLGRIEGEESQAHRVMPR